MIDVKELRRLAEDCLRSDTIVELKPAFGTSVIELLDELERQSRLISSQGIQIMDLLEYEDERAKLLDVLKQTRLLKDGVTGRVPERFKDWYAAVDACSSIKIEGDESGAPNET